MMVRRSLLYSTTPQIPPAPAPAPIEPIESDEEEMIVDPAIQQLDPGVTPIAPARPID